MNWIVIPVISLLNHRMSIEAIRAAVRDVPDFPKPGIVFKDITPILGDAVLFRQVTDHFAERYADRGVQSIAGIDARGFIFGAALADRLGTGFIPIRKAGKLPWKTKEQSYELEYGAATVAIHEDAVEQGEKVLLVDDLLATGGTAAAAIQLLESLGVDLIEVAFLVELSFLDGRKRLGDRPVYSPILY